MSDSVSVRRYWLGYLLFSLGYLVMGAASGLWYVMVLAVFGFAGHLAGFHSVTEGAKGSWKRSRLDIAYLLVFLSVVLADYCLPLASKKMVDEVLNSFWGPLIFWALGTAAFAYQWRRRVVA